MHHKVSHFFVEEGVEGLKTMSAMKRVSFAFIRYFILDLVLQFIKVLINSPKSFLSCLGQSRSNIHSLIFYILVYQSQPFFILLKLPNLRRHDLIVLGVSLSNIFIHRRSSFSLMVFCMFTDASCA
jgi:hypothetical protein